MSNTFPFGNDPLLPETWLGRFDCKSKRWLVSYWGGFSMIAGYHTFIFMGLDSPTIGKVMVKGVGLNVGFGARRTIGGGQGKMVPGTRNAERIDKTTDSMEYGISGIDAYNDEADLSASSAFNLLNGLMNDSRPSFMECEIPLSLKELHQTFATVSGFNADIYVAGSQQYLLTLHNSFLQINSDVFYVRNQHVYNEDDGGIGAGIGQMTGWCDMQENYDLAWALGAGKAPYERPYRLASSSRPYIYNLPPIQHIREHGVPAEALRSLPQLEALE